MGERYRGYGVDTSGLWNIQVQGYANWYPHGISRSKHSRSHVSAFRHRKYALEVKSENEWKGSHGRTLHLKRGEITPDLIKDTYLTIISSTILARFKQNNSTINFQYGKLWLSTWFSAGATQLGNSHTQIYVYEGDTISMSLFLKEIDKICTKKGISHVITVPQGFEDEGEILLSWVEGEGLPQKLEIMFTDELDFACLMGCSLATIRA
jgi:hypothetical protein